MQRNARRTADRKYMETLKKSGVDYDRLRQSSLEGSKCAEFIASDGEQVRSADSSPGRSSGGERSPDRGSAEDESLSHRSLSPPGYTRDDDSNSVIEEQLTELA